MKTDHKQKGTCYRCQIKHAWCENTPEQAWRTPSSQDHIQYFCSYCGYY